MHETDYEAIFGFHATYQETIVENDWAERRQALLVKRTG